MKGQYTGMNSQREIRDTVDANEPGPVPMGWRTRLQLTSEWSVMCTTSKMLPVGNAGRSNGQTEYWADIPVGSIHVCHHLLALLVLVSIVKWIWILNAWKHSIQEICKHLNHQAPVLGKENGRGMSRFTMCPGRYKIAWGQVAVGGRERTDSVNRGGHLYGYWY